jgi:DNA replication and repair protein RecF
VSLLATLRSFRSFRNRDLIEREQNDSVIAATVQRGEQRRDVKVTIHSNGKRVELNSKPVRDLGLFFGQLNTVTFSPEDVGVFKASPADRRLFFDRIIFNLTPAYAQEMNEYETALRSRNALLKVEHPEPALLEAWNEPLARAGAAVIHRRMRLLELLHERFQSAFSEIFAADFQATLAYECAVMDAGESGRTLEQTEQRLRAELRATTSRDVARGFTGVGPHRDDFLANLNGDPIRTWGSQGQHRAFVLALKTTEIRLLEQTLGFAPMLLLDDVSSELDPERNARLFQFLATFTGQVFITTTDPSFIRIDSAARRWRVREGTIHEG